MRKLTTSDIKDHREYEKEREEFRRQIIDSKRRRRIQLGDLLTMTFENTATMRFQVQEMARAERMLTEAQIEHEVETYNQLIPDPGELSGTLFVEINDKQSLYEWLPKLVDIQRAISIVIGDHPPVPSIPQDEERLTREETTSTVHYLKFAFPPPTIAEFRDGPVRIVVDHANYQTSVELTPEQRTELAGDLTPSVAA